MNTNELLKIVAEMREWTWLPDRTPSVVMRDWADRIERALAGQGEGERDAERMSYEALGFAFAYACSLLDRGYDPRQHEVPRLLEEWNAARTQEKSR